MKLIKFTVLYFVTLEGGKRLLKVKHLLSEPSKNRKRFHLYFLGVVISSFFSSHLLYGGKEGQKEIAVIVGVTSIQHSQNSLQPHPGVNMMSGQLR